MIILDIDLIETYNSSILAIADVSSYPPEKNIENPFIEITPPGFSKVGLSFIPKTVNLFNSTSIELTNPEVKPAPLPDGIYHLKYSVRPNYEIYTQKTFLKTNGIRERFDIAFLKADVSNCDSRSAARFRSKLDLISFYLQYAMAAANICNEKLAMDLYRKAQRLLDKFDC
ncbi:hypothetical protein SAMN05428988_3218 [Chitinophaga sp. YR573]|uniref:hypothetical protein n=1 Tax=Chitinophaga sp. YR573 TaxID=1881040 RepID=UPI0008D5AED0|nr:hypothetical protein [Chitinophaga sp. YR573]SEW21506.1 hypothetical protein SAMN05428988_3218 [Chitinophaga sp. YR573]